MILPFLLLAAAPAVAAATVNFAPVIDRVVLPAAATLVSGFAAYLLQAIAAWFKIKMTAAQSQVIENAMNNGINLAIHKIGVTLDANASLDVKNQAVAVALDYALPKVGKEMARVG